MGRGDVSSVGQQSDCGDDESSRSLPGVDHACRRRLPTANRRVSFTFYRDGRGLEPFGEAADDDVAEPLQFTLTTVSGSC